MNDNFIKDADIELIQKLMIEATAIDFNKTNEVSWTKLQSQAKDFIKAYEILNHKSYLLNNDFLKQIVNNPESATHIQGLRFTREGFIIKSKYLLAFNFDRYLNNYLNKQPKEALFVFEDEQNVLSTYKMSLINLAKHINAQGVIDISKNQLQIEQTELLENTKTSGIHPKHISQGQAAYKGTIARLGEYYTQANLSGSQAQGGLLMWKDSHNWIINTVLNKGDIKEAYASFLLTEHKTTMDYLSKKPQGKAEYYDDTLIATFFNEYINKVTNKPALLEEDIVTKERQYAVKSAAAIAPSLQQYIDAAKLIKNNKKKLSKKDLENLIQEKIIKNMDTKRNIKKSLNVLTENQLNAVIKVIQSKKF